jgi:hypothetical protein
VSKPLRDLAKGKELLLDRCFRVPCQN